MAAPLETPSYLTHQPGHRETRVHFASRASLLAGFARAQREPWVEDCKVNLTRRELWIRMAGGAPSAEPIPARAPLRVVTGGLDHASATIQ
jgi:hypothetical protein